jgi:hypothetical protein
MIFPYKKVKKIIKGDIFIEMGMKRYELGSKISSSFSFLLNHLTLCLWI